MGFDINVKKDEDMFGIGSIVTVKKIIAGGLADTQLEGASRLLVNDQIVAVNGVKLGTTPPKKIGQVFNAEQVVKMLVRTPVAQKEKAAAETGECSIC